MTNSFPWIILSIITLIGIFLIFFFKTSNLRKKSLQTTKKTGKYPEGYFINKYMAIFLPLGLAFGIPMGNVALGLPIGVAIGVAVGSAKEKEMKEKKKIRPLIKEEKQMKKISALVGFFTAILGIIAFTTVFILIR